MPSAYRGGLRSSFELIAQAATDPITIDGGGDGADHNGAPHGTRPRLKWRWTIDSRSTLRAPGGAAPAPHERECVSRAVGDAGTERWPRTRGTWSLSRMAGEPGVRRAQACLQSESRRHHLQALRAPYEDEISRTRPSRRGEDEFGGGDQERQHGQPARARRSASIAVVEMVDGGRWI